MEHKRGRSTRTLMSIAWNEFRACEACLPNQAFDYADDVLARIKLMQSERRRLEKQLYCPWCGMELSPLDRVAPYSQEEKRQIRRHYDWRKKYSSQFDAFQNFLTAYPTLGGLHSLGRELVKTVKNGKIIALEPRVWYRGRPYRESGRVVKRRFKKHFLWPDPKVKEVPAGRFNNERQAGVYLGDSLEAVAVETLKDEFDKYWSKPGRKNKQHRVWIARVNILEKLRVIDLRIPYADSDRLFSLLLDGLVRQRPPFVRQ